MHHPSKAITLLLAAGIMMTGAALRGSAQTKEFGNWPAGASPQEIGKRVAENIAARKFEWQTSPTRRFVIYPEVCAW